MRNTPSHRLTVFVGGTAASIYAVSHSSNFVCIVSLLAFFAFSSVKIAKEVSSSATYTKCIHHTRV